MTQVASVPHSKTPIDESQSSSPKSELSVGKTQAPSSARHYRTLRLLSELNIAEAAESKKGYHNRFAEKLAQLIDLSGSIKLSIAHSELSEITIKPSAVSVDDIKAEFLDVHSLVVDKLLQSFTPLAQREHRQWAELPSVDLLLPAVLDAKPDKALKPYFEFYRLQQKQITARVKRLRGSVQRAASGFSVQLAQLAKLDSVLGDELAMHSRRSFAQVTRMLSQRYVPMVEQSCKMLNAGPSNKNIIMQLHVELCREMQGLLLAELEVHLLPVLGLIEAIDEEID